MDYPTMSPASLYRLALDHPDRGYVAVLVLREGAVQALEHIELALYPPDTVKNDEYTIDFTPEWPLGDPNSMQWPIVGFPLRDRGKVEELLAVHGFRLAKGAPRMLTPRPNLYVLGSPQDVVPCPTAPVCCCAEGRHFPVAYASNFFTLEGNSKDRIHPNFVGARSGGTA